VTDPAHAPVTAGRRFLGWCVHAYTACGLLLAAGLAALLAQADRTPDTYRACFLLMLVAVLVDATDGTLARRVRVKEAVPEFDGRRLDDLVDFLTYTCLPLLLIDQAQLLPADGRWVLLVALVASGYGFSQADVKTTDGAFVGFPSYWNIVAYYLYRLPFEGWVAAAVILGLAALTFVPTRYPYPTQPGRVNHWMLALSVPWAVLIGIDLLDPWDTGHGGWAAWASALYPAAYLGISWVGSVRRGRGREAWV
jgi:phosphatidylcholine synthase